MSNSAARYDRVQDCAFGGMFCGSQTWSRVN
jgi:hypothetical protein